MEPNEDDPRRPHFNSLEEELRYLDEVLEVEKNYLDNPDVFEENLNEGEPEEYQQQLPSLLEGEDGGE